MICVKDLIKLNIFKKFELLSSENGLYRPVSWPNIAQTQSIKEWLVGGDVIIMTGVGLDISLEFWKNILHECIEKGAACLIVLKNESIIESIPQEVIEFAESAEFSIFMAPWETKIAHIVRDVFKLIADDKYEDNLKNLFWDRVKDEEGFSSESSIYTMLEKYSLTETYTVVLLKFDEIRYKNSEQEHMMSRIKHTLSEFFGTVLIIEKERNIYIFIPYLNSLEIEKKLYNINKEILRAHPFLKSNIKYGVGKTKNGLTGYRDAICTAQEVIKLCENKNMLSYDELGLYKLLMDLPDQKMVYEYMYDNIGKLIEVDNKNVLVQTLEMYFECNENAKETANKLFVHRNTLSNRLERIHKILEFSFDDVQKKHDIYNALMIRKYIKQ